MPLKTKIKHEFLLIHPITGDSFVFDFYREEHYELWKDFLEYLDQCAHEYVQKGKHINTHSGSKVV